MTDVEETIDFAEELTDEALDRKDPILFCTKNLCGCG